MPRMRRGPEGARNHDNDKREQSLSGVRYGGRRPCHHRMRRCSFTPRKSKAGHAHVSKLADRGDGLPALATPTATAHGRPGRLRQQSNDTHVK